MGLTRSRRWSPRVLPANGRERAIHGQPVDLGQAGTWREVAAGRRDRRQFDPPLAGVYSARVMREWRVLYTIDEKIRRVLVKSVAHRRDAYRT